MQIVRTILWMLLLAALIAFSAINWRTIDVRIWTDLTLETKIPALVVVAFIAGLLPMWLLHRGTLWRYRRRIAGLEQAARTQAATHRTELEAMQEAARPHPVPAQAPSLAPATSIGTAADGTADGITLTKAPAPAGQQT